MPNTRTSASESARAKSGRNNSRATAAARAEILQQLKDDHKRVKKAFRDFEKLDASDAADECHALVMGACAELKIHARLEEELVYPAARESLDAESLVDEAEVEHASAKSLIAQLENMQPGDDKYAATFTVLGEYVKHHIREEETEMFPQLEHAKLDWQNLRSKLEARRQALTRELMPATKNDEEDAEEDKKAAEKETSEDSPGGFVREKPDVQDEEGLPES